VTYQKEMAIMRFINYNTILTLFMERFAEKIYFFPYAYSQIRKYLTALQKFLAVH